jgi:hypothetical protein
MSEIADIFNALKELKKERKQNNLEYSTQLLIDKNISFESKNYGVHLIVNHNNKIIDFWPSTGKWKDRKKSHYCRGVKKLIAYIEVI